MSRIQISNVNDIKRLNKQDTVVLTPTKSWLQTLAFSTPSADRLLAAVVGKLPSSIKRIEIYGTLASLDHLTKFENLTSFKLKGRLSNPLSLKPLSTLGKLQTVVIDTPRAPLTSGYFLAQVKALANLKSLQTLKLRAAELDIQNFSWVPSSITKLQLGGRTTINSLITLSHLRNLSALSITMPYITMSDILVTAATLLTTTKFIDLGNILGNAVNYGLIRTFKEACPTVKVDYDDR